MCEFYDDLEKSIIWLGIYKLCSLLDKHMSSSMKQNFLSMTIFYLDNIIELEYL